MHSGSYPFEPAGQTKKIIVARHGQYSCNVAGVCNCDPRQSFSLTALGEMQALALGEKLVHENIEMIVTSSFLRARQTGWLANHALQVNAQLVHRGANENRVGSALEGKSNSLFLDMIASDPIREQAVDGESYWDFKGRVEGVLHDLCASSPTTILLIAHGWTLQVIRSLQGLVTDEEAAMCVGMPGNCDYISGYYREGKFIDSAK